MFSQRIGTIIGITIAYFIGNTLGITFFEKYGHYFHLSPKKLENISAWFNKYGEKLLIVAFFLPGIRHITGYFSGVTNLKYRDFAVNAYIGALIWTTTFITLGMGLGSKWSEYHKLISKFSIIIGSVVGVIMMTIYIYRNHRNQIYQIVLKILEYSIRTYRSLGEIKIIILGFSTFFIILSGILVEMSKAYFSNDFMKFDEVNKFLIDQTFDNRWQYLMKAIKNLASVYALLVVVIFSIAWVFIKKINIILEVKFILITSLCPIFLVEILLLIFKQGLQTNIFPNYETLLAVVVYGFFAYLIARHTKKLKIGTISIIVTLILCFLIGISVVYLGIAYPSNVIICYVFGGIWLSINIALLEIFRVLTLIKYENYT